MRCNFSWRITFAVLLATILLNGIGHAAPTLKDAVESAWAKHPVAQSRAARQDEASAKRELAASWLADAPRVSVSQKTDRWNQNAGSNEWEAEIGVSLQMPGVRAARGVLAESEATRYDAHAAAEKWRVAGEVREAYWSARIDASDLALATRKVAEASALSADVERRFKVGEIARTDWNQAHAALKMAESAEADSRAKAFRSARAFLALTALPPLPIDDESWRDSKTSIAIEQHPQLRELLLDAEVARARQQEANATGQDAPEIAFGAVRERSAYGEATAGSVVLRLTVPLPSGARNRSRVSLAGAERIEAESRVPQMRLRIDGDIASAVEDLSQATRQVEFAQSRAALARETHALLDKAYRLGELDLQARLRAEADRFDAELSLARANLHRSRSISRINQASGILP